MRHFKLSLLLWLALAMPADAWNSPAPGVVLYCSPAMEPALRLIAQRYRAETQIEVHIFTAPPDGLQGLIKHRARADVVVSDATTLAQLAAGGFVQPASLTRLGRDPFILIENAKNPPKPAATAASLTATRTIILPGPTTAATFDGPAILQQALPAQDPGHQLTVSDTPTVIAMVRANSQMLGLVYQTEAQAPGIVAAAPLPAAAPTPISAALVTNGQSANAGAFLAYIAGPKGTQILHHAGLEATS